MRFSLANLYTVRGVKKLYSVFAVDLFLCFWLRRRYEKIDDKSRFLLQWGWIVDCFVDYCLGCGFAVVRWGDFTLARRINIVGLQFGFCFLGEGVVGGRF